MPAVQPRVHACKNIEQFWARGVMCQPVRNDTSIIGPQGRRLRKGSYAANVNQSASRSLTYLGDIYERSKHKHVEGDDEVDQRGD